MGKIKSSFIIFMNTSRHVRWILLSGIIVIFLILLYPNLIHTELVYNLGDVVEHDIKAPKDFLIEDSEATENNRKKALEEVLAVYDLD